MFTIDYYYYYSTTIPTLPGDADFAFGNCDSSARMISIWQLNSFSKNSLASVIAANSSCCEMILSGIFERSLSTD